MIPEYRMRHGMVLSSLLSEVGRELRIKALDEDGRQTSYLLDGAIGLHIKHASQRISPWHFAFSPDEVASLHEMCAQWNCFIGLVCGTDGVCVVPASDALTNTTEGQGLWLRVSRGARKQYSIFGPGGQFPGKFEKSIGALSDALQVKTD